MRSKLQIFTNFANTLLPHETRYLLAVQQLADQVKLGILERVDYSCQHINQFTPYDDPNIDKRKYSHLKNWVQQRLTELDVDAHFEWMSTLERQITKDAIEAEEEKNLLREIRQYEHPGFFFTKFYELVQQYRWHTFFTAYMGALLSQCKFQKMIRVTTKYRLLDLEKGYETRPDYVPALLWHTSIAQYKEEIIDKNTLQRRLQDYFNAHRGEKDRSHQIGELLNELKPHAPEVINYLQIWA